MMSQEPNNLDTMIMMLQEPNNLDAMVFVYVDRVSGEVITAYWKRAQEIERQKTHDHVDTLEPRLWIQAHYSKVVKLRRKNVGEFLEAQR